MKIRHIVKTYFYRRIREQRTEDQWREWFDKRIEIFLRYTMKSLQDQDFKDFNLWVWSQEDMRPFIASLEKRIPWAVFTYWGHYIDGAQEAEMEKIRGADYVYITRIDSDDVYRRDALGLCNDVKADGLSASMFLKGPIHDIQSGKWGIYWKDQTPFHTLHFPTEIFMNQAEYERNFYGDHSQVRNNYRTVRLPDMKFCVLTHGFNHSSTFQKIAKRETPGIEGTVDDFIEGRSF